MRISVSYLSSGATFDLAVVAPTAPAMVAPTSWLTTANEPLSLVIQAADPNGQKIDLSVQDLPVDAVFTVTPAPETSDSVDSTPIRGVAGVFVWTPTIAQIGMYAEHVTATSPAGSTTQATFLFHAKAAGFLEARVTSTNGRGDAFPQDDAAIIQVPVGKTLRVAVYSPEPDLLKPLLAGNAQVQATFDLPAKYDPQAAADLVVFDRFLPKDPPTNVASVWIEPPAGSPFAMRSTASKVKLDRWHQDTALGAGLYTKDVELASTEVFTLAPGDQAVAETAQGPVVVQRQGAVKMAALGFDPVRSTMKYDLATPLLIANLLRWMAPEVFRRSDVQAGTVGTVNVTLDKGVNPASVKVLGDDQRPLPFTIEGNRLQFFAGAAGNVRVVTGDRETVFSLTLPDVGDVTWRPPADVARGVRRGLVESSSAPNPWPWLALAGGLGLLADWLLYGRKQIVRLKPRAASPNLVERLRGRKAS